MQSIDSRVCELQWLQHVVSVAVVHGLSCGVFPDQELNLRLLPWQADSYPLSHKRSPSFFLSFFFKSHFTVVYLGLGVTQLFIAE